MENNLQQEQPHLLSQESHPIISCKMHALSNLRKSKIEHNSEQPFLESTSSDTDNEDEAQESAVSDSESCIIGSTYQDNMKSDGLIKIDEGDKLHEVISRKFISGFGALGLSTRIEAIHKNFCASFMKRARLQSFLIFSKAMEKKCGGNANVKYAWFGASKDEMDSIFSHGFGHPINSEAYGHCICLSPDDHPLDCLQTAIPDMDRVRHLMLCRVILGRTEVVHPGSVQSHPSSEEFDTGVDNINSPRKYIVWSTNMNAYVFPEFMISFRVTSDVKESRRFSVPSKFPTSPWVSFPSLISTLSKILPPKAVKLIKKYHSDYKASKITRRELIQEARKLAGDELLTAIIKSFRNKQNKGSDEDSSTSNNGKVETELCLNGSWSNFLVEF